MSSILITGAAGFIGAALAERLLQQGKRVVGVDNLNDYYDPRLKQARLDRLAKGPGDFEFYRLDTAQRQLRGLPGRDFDQVVHFAAQAGVRYSISQPYACAESNLAPFLNLLEFARELNTRHFVYASTSAVYGSSPSLPSSEMLAANHPASLYAATKKAAEVMSHAYSHAFGLATTGLRFFTVYGPFGRPDMALFRFTRAILAGEPVQLYNQGRHRRDFTYIDDIVEGVVRVLELAPGRGSGWQPGQSDPDGSLAPGRIYNIGSGEATSLMQLLALLEEKLDRKARVELLPMQPGDVEDTRADVSRLAEDTGYRPKTSLREGVSRFVDWYLDYFGPPCK